MPTVEHPPVSQPRSGFKDDAPALRRPSPEPFRTNNANKSHLDPPKSIDKPPAAPAKPPSKAEVVRPPSPPPDDDLDSEKDEGEMIDREIFDQILELDEEEEGDEFSRSMVWGFFEQAAKTFGEMNDALAAKDLEKLSSLGHFLKGSSAALGLLRVQATCEKIQNCGHLHDGGEAGARKELSESQALAKMVVLLKRVKVEYDEAKIWLENFFEQGGAQ